MFIVSRYFIYQRTALSWPDLWLNTKTVCRREVTHPSTNQARRKYSYFVNVRDDVITTSQTVKLLLVGDLKGTYWHHYHHHHQRISSSYKNFRAAGSILSVAVCTYHDNSTSGYSNTEHELINYAGI